METIAEYIDRIAKYGKKLDDSCPLWLTCRELISSSCIEAYGECEIYRNHLEKILEPFRKLGEKARQEK